jgi:DNA-directed RNA polymerase subunit RPC12/RpoP
MGLKKMIKKPMTEDEITEAKKIEEENIKVLKEYKIQREKLKVERLQLLVDELKDRRRKKEEKEKIDHALLDGYTRIKCPCGYYVDFKVNDLQLLRNAGKTGFECPECGRVFGKQFLKED